MRGGELGHGTALEMRLPIYELRIKIYDLLIMYALRKFSESSTCADEFAGSVIIMTVCCHIRTFSSLMNFSQMRFL